MKQVITSTPVLALYDAARPTMVSADSSSYGLGTVLQQQQPDGSWRPVFYASRSLTDVERRYAQVEKECLALTWACERLSDYVIGIRFVLRTDHKPLVSLLSSSRPLDDVPPRIQRMRIRLMRFDYSVTWQPGSQLFTADTLSRFPLENEPSIVDSSDVIERYVSVVVNSLPITDVLIDKVLTASTTDDAIPDVIRYCTTKWPDDNDHLPPAVKSYWPSRDNFTVQNGLLLHGAHCSRRHTDLATTRDVDRSTRGSSGHRQVPGEGPTVRLVAEDQHRHRYVRRRLPHLSTLGARPGRTDDVNATS